MNNEKKPNQPMYMRASVSNAFSGNSQSKNGVFVSIFFLIFVIGIVALVVWSVFFGGIEFVKNFIYEFLLPRIEK